MSSKNLAVALSLSAAFLAFSPLAKASSLETYDGITVGTKYVMAVSNYPTPVEKNGSGYDVGTTLITIYTDAGNGKEGSVVATFEGFCIDFADSIRTPTSYEVIAQGVGSTSGSPTDYDSALGGPSDSDLEHEAALGAQFDGVTSNDATYQDAIWDYSGASYGGASITAANAVAAANLGSYTGANNDVLAFLEVNGGYSGGTTSRAGSYNWGADGQSFMEVPAGTPLTPPTTPEPSSLVLMGTGLVGLAGAMRRKLVKV